MITAYIDGGSRGNPGLAGYGVQIVGDDGAVVAELHGSLPHATNNIAEYNGLLAALSWAVDHGHGPCTSARTPSCSSNSFAASTASRTPASSRSISMPGRWSDASGA